MEKVNFYYIKQNAIILLVFSNGFTDIREDVEKRVGFKLTAFFKFNRTVFYIQIFIDL